MHYITRLLSIQMFECMEALLKINALSASV